MTRFYIDTLTYPQKVMNTHAITSAEELEQAIQALPPGKYRVYREVTSTQVVKDITIPEKEEASQ